mgnify:CR=1 FL=1
MHQSRAIVLRQLKYSETSLILKIYTEKEGLLSFKLINKIKDQGYIENNYDYPSAVILIKDNKWRWIMSSSGNHRAHIKKELNYNYINCKAA